MVTPPFWVLSAPFAIQALAMFFDEFYFHRKRGLGRWERWGHPIDTASVICCYLFLVSRHFTQENLLIYIFLSSFSCLLITKDEFIHTKVCTPAESWLHGLLFVIHPITLGLAGYFWYVHWQFMIYFQAIVSSLFISYQLLYWGILWKPAR